MPIMTTCKRLLLIAPVFFGYYQEIIREAEELGFATDYICDAPSNTNLSKAVGRINKTLIKGAAERYFRMKVRPALEGKAYDYVLLVAGMTFAFSPKMIEDIRRLNPKATFVIYQWDSERNLPYSTKIHRYFDRIYSFDRFDCIAKREYRFLPLFYTRIYEEAGQLRDDPVLYDCSYVGTAHPQKYSNINLMAEKLKDFMPRQFIYHFMPSRLKFLYHKLTAIEYRKAKLSDFHMQKISPEKLIMLFRQSRCVLDAPQAGQTGLSIRSIECLGAKKKLITTNEDIVNYDFYRETNILVFQGSIDRNSPFFTGKYEEVPASIYQKYSLRRWLETMLGEPSEGGAI